MSTLSGLTKYTKYATETYTQGVVYSDFKKRFELQKGVKYKAKLQFATSDVTLLGEGCGQTATGNGTWTEKDIETQIYRTNTYYCEDNFNDYMLPYSEAIKIMIGLEQEDINEQIADQIWTGDTTTTGSTDLINGIVYKFNNNSGVLSAGYSVTPLTSSNVDDAIAAMVTKIFATPNILYRMTKKKQPIVINMSVADYQKYKTNRMQANYYHDKSSTIDDNSSWLFGYIGKIKAQAVSELPENTNMYATWDKNIKIAVDERYSKSYFKVVYDEVNDRIHLQSKTKVGVELKFNNECITLR